MANWQLLGCYADLFSLLLFSKYYRKFIENIEEIVQPLEKTLNQYEKKKGSKHSTQTWTSDEAGKKFIINWNSSLP